MEENTKNEQPMDLDEEQLQTITGGTGGRIQNFNHAPKDPNQYDAHMLIKQHEREAKQALNDAESFGIAGFKKEADKSFKDAKMHYDMIAHIYNNINPLGLAADGQNKR
jgi:hypothetical protein